jgi:radical SAM superfamily enzyme YgiQ (UPF0313 family)
MHYEGTTYRPPPEADTPLLQVTVGCAHNRCTFCHMYRDVKFRRSPTEEIEADLEEARGIYRRAERFFLVNGDAFVLRADTLAEIAEKIASTFPECRTIAMYASIRTIRTKSDANLLRLRQLGVNDLYVGIESGWDTVLERINKGHTVAEARHQLDRLKQAGIGYRANVMLGVAGRGNGAKNARLTAAFLSDTNPNLIWVGTMAIFEGTPLHRDMERGEFQPATEMEILEEEKILIDNIRLQEVTFYGSHPTNSIPLLGTLSNDRDHMVAAIDAGIQRFGEDYLSRPLLRSTL